MHVCDHDSIRLPTSRRNNLHFRVMQQQFNRLDRGIARRANNSNTDHKTTLLNSMMGKATANTANFQYCNGQKEFDGLATFEFASEEIAIRTAHLRYPY
jgi:hypothetical protein